MTPATEARISTTPRDLIEGYQSLTQKEREVLSLLGEGLSNRQIAGRLFVTEFTVKKHMGQILAKLGVPDRTQAALCANVLGISHFAFTAVDHEAR